MTAIVARQVARLIPCGRVPHLVVGEVPAAQGIADIVAVEFDPHAVRARLAAGAGPVVSPLRVRVLHQLRVDRGMRASTLARKLGSNAPALIKSTLEPLAELGLLEIEDDLVRATGVWRPAAAQVTAVELKLSKWRSALRQADNFAVSADRSWVVLDSQRTASAVAAADHFRAFGVGLAVVDVEGHLRVVVRPLGRRPERWLRSLMAEHAWAAAEREVAALAGGTHAGAAA